MSEQEKSAAREPAMNLDELEGLYRKAPQGPWFKCDSLSYLHYANDAKMPVDPHKPWDYPVVGRFDYGPGALDFIQAIHEHFRASVNVCRVVAMADEQMKKGFIPPPRGLD